MYVFILDIDPGVALNVEMHLVERSRFGLSPLPNMVATDQLCNVRYFVDNRQSAPFLFNAFAGVGD